MRLRKGSKAGGVLRDVECFRGVEEPSDVESEHVEVAGSGRPRAYATIVSNAQKHEEGQRLQFKHVLRTGAAQR